jgi:hypothetical protein
MVRRPRAVALASAVGLLMTLVACGHSAAPTPVASTPSAGAKAAGASGSFGDLGRICGPAKTSASPTSASPTSASPGVRGLTDKTIRVGTIGDPGAALTPGLEQEYFDVGAAFTKWCNAAGGINGRKIVLDKYDAKLFNGAQAIIDACQRDFMLVGNGNAFDAVDVKPRLACKLGEIPAVSISPEAAKAGLQVQATGNAVNEYAIGPLRTLAKEYPPAQGGLGIGSSNVASLSPQGRSAQEAYESLGYRVSLLQEKPPAVANFRAYMEQMKLAGAKAYAETVSVDPAPEVAAMNDVGWKPAFVLWNFQFYDPKSVAAAKAEKFPPSFVALDALPAELVDQYPVLQEIRSILNAGVAHPKFTSFTGLAFSAWALWAKSATECGADLTQECVLAKAAHPDWDAGGLFPPHSTVPGKQNASDCFLLVRLTPNGFVYDKKATQPNRGVYNCNPDNYVPVSGN